MNVLNKLIQSLDSFLPRLLAVLMGLLVVDVAWQVMTRFVLPKPSSFTEELARFLLIWISLLGAAYAYRLHSHLGLDLFVKKLSPKNAMMVFRINCVLVAIFAVVVLIVGGSHLVSLTWLLGQQSPVLNISMAYIYSVVPISGAIFLIYSISFLINVNNINAESEQ